MSTRFDVLDAKQKYEDHVAAHKCEHDEDNPGTPKPCLVRTALMLAWNGGSKSAAGRWGQEKGDEDRQRKQFFERYPGTLPTQLNEINCGR